ncbi:MAG: DNA-3-methyladenine glycosylase 2 family protein [Rhodanobacteraceae bacterium]|nr:DNA-3-methyladenine glycosylase 2 family protein [Rhodanobacteraceae bacterium]
MSSDVDRLAREHLRERDPKLAIWMTRVGDLPLPRPEPFALVHALARSIIFQQLNGKAAETIFGRLQQALGGRRVSARALAAADESDLRAAGVSGSKIRALKDLAAHAQARRLPSPDALHAMSDEEAIDKLTIVRGIGPWTVQMLLMFRMGRVDILPLSDFGVRAGAQLVHGLDAMPGTAQLAELGAPWAPYRSLASLYLWRAVDTARENKD